MTEWLDTSRFQPIAPLSPDLPQPDLQGYTTLQSARRFDGDPSLFEGFTPQSAYADYMNLNKTFVDRQGAEQLLAIAEKLKDEWLPDYLDAGGWAAAEAALVCSDLDATTRMNLLLTAEDCWERALMNQGDLKESYQMPWLLEDTKEFRIALNLAFSPLMKSIIAGDVTKKTREKVFADTLAIAQTSAVQLSLARQSRFPGAAGAYSGFGHECNALLAFLYVNDPNFLPIPSTYRAGTGYEHRSQTHDLTIVNQHWGNIWNIYPVEIKARPKLKDKKRYEALIIKGRAHLTLPGIRFPQETSEAFAATYEGRPTEKEARIVQHSTSTVRELLTLYRKGEIPEEFREIETQTSFHTKDHVVDKYPELRAS